MEQRGTPASVDVTEYVPAARREPTAFTAFSSTDVLARAGVLAIGCAASAFVSWRIPSPIAGVPVLWLPIALGVAALFFAPRYQRAVFCVAVAVGTGSAGLGEQISVARTALAGAVTALAGYVIAWVLGGRLRAKTTLRAPGDVVVVAAVLASCAPLAALAFASPGSDAWLLWVSGWGAASLCMLPLLFAMGHEGVRGAVVRMLASAFGMIAVAIAVYGRLPDVHGVPRGMMVLALPVLVMLGVAVRLGLRPMGAAAAAYAATALPLTAADRGPFALPAADPAEQIAAAAVFVAVTALAGTILTSLVRAHGEATTMLSRHAESFDAIAAGAPLGVLVLDPGGRCVSVNRWFTDVTGIEEERARGSGWIDMVHPDDRERMRLRWHTAFDDQASVHDRFRILGPQGAVRWVSAIIEARRDRDGVVTGFAGVLTDVTGDVEADDAKQSFLSRISHELRTPLTIILGLTQTMTRPDLTDEMRTEMQARVLERAMHLNGLIDRLLIETSDRGDIERPPPVAVDLLDVIEPQLLRVREAGYDAVADVPGDLPRGWAPVEAVGSVVAELVDNAMKFSPGGGSIGIDARAGNGAVIVGVSDWGIGMDDEQQRRCFEKFWQAESKDTRRYEGTGIGLHVVKTVVESWGGTVTVKSLLGSGSRFEFTLPRAPATARADAQRKHA